MKCETVCGDHEDVSFTRDSQVEYNISSIEEASIFRGVDGKGCNRKVARIGGSGLSERNHTAAEIVQEIRIIFRAAPFDRHTYFGL